MKKYVTLVFEYETDAELQVIREASAKNNCRAWSMDHEILRVDLMRQAIEDHDLVAADRYGAFDGIIELRDEIRNEINIGTWTHICKDGERHTTINRYCPHECGASYENNNQSNG